MSQTAFIDLLIVSGSNTGMKYTIGKGSYRILGRSDVLEGETTQLTKTGDAALSYDKAIIVNSHLKLHSRSKNLMALARGPDIILDDPAVSKSHAMVFHSEDVTSVVDLKSTNGTLLNGKPIESSNLEEKDIIQIGSTKIMALPG